MTVSRIDVVGLGPAGPGLITRDTRSVIDRVPHRFLRTARHPAAEAVLASGATTFDHLYEQMDTFDEVYTHIVDGLLEAAAEHGRVVYAVPGSPAVAERTVELLLAARESTECDVEVVVHPAMSFLDLAWVRLGVDPVTAGVHLVDGHRFLESAPSSGGAVLVAQCESQFTLSEIKLSVTEPPSREVVLLQRLGLPDEVVLEVEWADIDRSVEPDHLTSLWIPELPRGVGGRVERFAALMGRLRTEDAWKAEQNHDSLKRYLLEEAHEVLEALDAYDPASGVGGEELAAELGDLLYQVVFHSALGAEAGWFGLAEVVDAIHDKLESRHPHLGSETSPAVEDLVAAWERSKVSEHGRASAFDGIPAELPALLRAMKLARKAEALGLELPVGDEEGPGADLLLAALSVVAAGHDPEDALRRELRQVEAGLRSQEAGRRGPEARARPAEQ